MLMKRHIKRHKDYEVTKEGWIHVYPSAEVKEEMPNYREFAALLRGTAKNLISFVLGRERFWSHK
jgi:hypothetical protein